MSKDNSLPLEVTLHVRDTCLCLYLQRAARSAARLFDEALRPVGLTSGQFSLLMSLNRPGKIKPGPVAELLAMDRTTLTANIKPLERRGLMETKVDPDDKRARLLMLTEEGRAVLKQAYPIWQETHRLLDQELTNINPDSLRQALTSLSSLPTK